eukprot:g3994.t1
MEEWVELFNPSSDTINLNGWKVSDKTISGAVTLSDLSISPLQRVVVVVKNRDGYLNNGSDSVILYNSAGETVDTISWNTPAPGDQSLVRLPDGGAWFTSSNGNLKWVIPTRGITNGNLPGQTKNSKANDDYQCKKSFVPLQIGSFNIQNFGKSKAGRPALMEKLGEISARYDVVSIQELEQSFNENDKSCAVKGHTGSAACTLLDAVELASVKGKSYSLAASPRLPIGSTSQEQYVILFNKNRFQIEREATFADTNQEFVRDPWAVLLSDHTTNTNFVVISIHTPPSQATSEIEASYKVLDWAVDEFNCKNIVYLGDFNADGSYFNTSKWPKVFENISAFQLITPDTIDTTVAVSHNAYDRIIINKSWQIESEKGGGEKEANAYRFDEVLNFKPIWEEGCSSGYIKTVDCDAYKSGTSINRTAALELSDHYPLEITLCIPEYQNVYQQDSDLKPEALSLVHVFWIAIFSILVIFLCLILKRICLTTKK